MQIQLSWSSKWTVSSRTLGGNTVSGVAILAKEDGVPTAPQSGLETLATVTLKVLRNPVGCLPTGVGCPWVRCTIHSLESIKEKDIVPKESKAIFADRFMAATGTFPTEGKLTVVEDSIVGLFASLQHRHLLNTALLHGAKKEYPIAVRTVRARSSSITAPQAGFSAAQAQTRMSQK
jgi:hypothetical protein